MSRKTVTFDPPLELKGKRRAWIHPDGSIEIEVEDAEKVARHDQIEERLTVLNTSRRCTSDEFFNALWDIEQIMKGAA